MCHMSVYQVPLPSYRNACRKAKSEQQRMPNNTNSPMMQIVEEGNNA